MRLLWVVLMLALVACSAPQIGAPSCDAAAVATTFQPITTEWADAVALAGSVPRMSLADPVAKLQEIRRRTQALTVPACGEDAKVSLLASMDSTIEGFLGFLSSQPDATVQGHFTVAADHMADFQGKLTALGSPEAAAGVTAIVLERTNIALTPTVTPRPTATIVDGMGDNVIASYTKQGYTRENTTSADGRPTTVLTSEDKTIHIYLYGSPVDTITLENTAYEEGAAGVAIIEDLFDTALPGNSYTTGFTRWAYGQGILSTNVGQFKIDATIDPGNKRATYTIMLG